MRTEIDRDEDGYVVLRIPMDDVTAARLMEIADMHHTKPELIAYSIVRDVLEDDAQAHDEGPVSLELVTLN